MLIRPKVFLSPSNQTDNVYAGLPGVTERDVCGKIADACLACLDRHGIPTLMMHDEDMETKVTRANAWGADLYVPIHTNASGKGVTGTRIFYGSDREPAQAVYDRLAPYTPGDSDNITQSLGLYEVRKPEATSIYVECEFHDVPTSARWIVEHEQEIGERIAQGILDYCEIPYEPEQRKDKKAALREIMEEMYDEITGLLESD